MKRIIRWVLFPAWLFVGTLLLSRWWFANPDWFPPLSDASWRRLDRLFGATDVDGASNMELFVVVFLAFVAVAAATSALWLAWRQVRRHGSAA